MFLGDLRVLPRVFVGVLLVAKSVVVAELVQRVAPASMGMSGPRLERINSTVKRFVDEQRIAGAVTLVARRGAIVHFEAHGDRDVSSGEAMTKDTIFSIASMTKPITSVAVMLLWEEGRILLSDPVERYLPEFRDVKLSTTGDVTAMTGDLVTPKSKITIRQLLTHTAGLSPSGRGANNAYYTQHVRTSLPGDTIADWVKRIASLPLTQQPGKRWVYSHATDVLARVVEVVSGMTFADFLHERIFVPLAMTSTQHYPSASQSSRVATIYRPSPDGGVAPLQRASNEGRSDVLYRGAGGLTSTAGDYFRFAQMMLNKGTLSGVRLLGRRTVELMVSDHVGDFPWGKGEGFGLGFAVVNDPGEAGQPVSEGSFYWSGAFGTRFFVDPVEELVAVLMIQLNPNRDLGLKERFRALVYQSIID